MNNKNLRILLGILGLILLMYLLWNVRSIIYYFFSAVIIAFIGRPLMILLGRIRIKGRGLPGWLRALMVLLSFGFLLFGFFQLIIPTVISQADIISRADPKILLENIDPYLTDITGRMDKFSIDREELDRLLIDEMNRIFQVSQISLYLRTMVSGLTSTLVAVFSTLFISFFLLKDGTIVDNMVKSLTPDKYLEKIQAIFVQTKNLLSRYFIGIVLQIIIVMTLTMIGLSVIGVHNAIIIGFIAGVFNIIPYVGPLIGGLVGISLALTTQVQIYPEIDIVAFGIRVLVVFVITQAIDNNLLQPLIFSKSVKAHPLEIFIVILAAGNLAGVTGMILAVPAYTFIRIVAKEFFNGYKVVQGLTKNI